MHEGHDKEAAFALYARRSVTGCGVCTIAGMAWCRFTSCGYTIYYRQKDPGAQEGAALPGTIAMALGGRLALGTGFQYNARTEHKVVSIAFANSRSVSLRATTTPKPHRER